VPPLACYNFDTRERISIFFGRNATDKIRNQKTLYCATSNNLCFCTIWQNGETRKLHFHSSAVLLQCQNSSSRCLISSIFFTHTHAALWLSKSCNQCAQYRTVGGMVQEKESREHCSSWTVLHAQCTSVLSSGFPLLQGNAKTLDRWGGKTKHHLIFYFLRNTSAKNYHNRIVYVNIASQRLNVFFWDIVYMLLFWITFWSIHVYKTFSMYLFAITERDCAKRLLSTYFEQGGCYGS